MHYEVEVGGLERRVELPFVTAVFADLAGRPAEPPTPVADRRFVDVDVDNFDGWIEEVAPRLAFAVADRLGADGALMVELRFRRLDDFRPRAVARQVEPLRAWLDADEAPAAEHAPAFDAQLSAILQHPDFRKLEAAWRGLHELVSRNEPDGLCPVRVMSLTKAELAKTLRRYKGTAWDQSPIFKRLFDDESGSAGGQPFGCVVLDFEFDHGAADVETLAELARIGAACQAPMLTGAAPALIQMESWQEIVNPRDLSKIFTTPEYAAWRALRERDDARSLTLALPRFLARAPYVQERVGSGRAFTEQADDPHDFVWSNPAFLLASNIQRAFRIHGWFARIAGLTSGGAVEGLAQAPKQSGLAHPVGPIEVAINDRRIGELANNGLIGLAARARGAMATFTLLPTLHKPAEYDDIDATDRARLQARLSYGLMAGRIAHHLKAMARDRPTAPGSREALQEQIERWIADYVDPAPAAPNAFTQAARPLESAQVVVDENPGQPGHLTTRFTFVPRE